MHNHVAFPLHLIPADSAICGLRRLNGSRLAQRAPIVYTTALRQVEQSLRVCSGHGNVIVKIKRVYVLYFLIGQGVHLLADQSQFRSVSGRVGRDSLLVKFGLSRHIPRCC